MLRGKEKGERKREGEGKRGREVVFRQYLL